MKIKGNDIHLTQRELLTAALAFIKQNDPDPSNVPFGTTVDDVYGIAAPVRISGERYDYIVSIKDETATPTAA
jgi:hypothetical protein